MSDIVFTGLVMAGAYGIVRLMRKIRENARMRLEEKSGSSEPRDLGSLTQASDGTFVPDQH